MANVDSNYTPPGGQMGSSDAQQMLQNFWPETLEEIRNLQSNDFKAQELPLARIKKIMKLDEDVKMISAEAPVLFSKAAEIFISELSLRAWIHTEDNKRRTLQKNDIAMAVTKYDQFDFLIDIVPRDEIKTTKRQEETGQRAAMMPEQVQYYFQLAQQHQAALQQQPATQPQVHIQQANQVMQQPIQIQVGSTANTTSLPVTFTQAASDVTQTQLIQVQPTSQQHQQPQQQQQQQATMQVYQQVTSPSGEVQTIPIQLTQAQLQAIATQMQGKQPGQPIVIQTTGQQNQSPQPQQTCQTDQTGQFSVTQPLFQVPLTIAASQMPAGATSQQVYIQQNSTQDDDTTEIIQVKAPS